MSENIPVSISDKAIGDLPPREALAKLRETGFTHIHFSQGWRSKTPLTDEEVQTWLDHLEATDMAVLDVHGSHPPAPDNITFWDDNPEHVKLAEHLFITRLHITRALGATAMVHHVPNVRLNDDNREKVISGFIEGLARMEDHAREQGVIVALENMFFSETDKAAFSASFERFSPEYIRFTFDTGHAIRSGNTDWLLENCMDRLHILHLHDNEPGKDRHWLPLTETGHVEWDRVSRAIAASPYDKPLQFEVGWKPDRYADYDEFRQLAYERAMAICEKVAKYRENRVHS